MPTSISQYVATYQKIADAILASGPDIQDDLTDMRFIVDAVRRIKDRTTKRFGLSADEGTFLTEEQSQQFENSPEVKAINEKLAGKLGVGAEGVKGPFSDLLMQLVQLIASNPALLTLILSLFKKTA